MTEEPEKPTEAVNETEEPEVTPTADTPRSDEPDTAAEPETEAAPGASPAAAPSRPHGDELSQAVDEVASDDAEPEALGEEATEEAEDAAAGEEAGEETPKRARRPRRRRGAAEETAAQEPPTIPAPTRRRSQRDPDQPAPVVRAQAKYVRSSARKARLVCDHIRGKSVQEARAILAVTPRAIARDWSKLLESAVANAEHNHELVGEDLYVKAVHADEGPTIKRFRPRAMGRATPIRKRTSHLTILLTEKN
jgi:large subunit ribosomal protein L22